MPTKRKFTSKFPTTRIKKIMQLDKDVGKLTATVPPVVSKALELFIEQLINTAYELTQSRNSKTISPGFIKLAIDREPGFGFLRPLVANISEPKQTNYRKYSKVSESESLSGSSDNELSNDDVCSANIPEVPKVKQKRKQNSTNKSNGKTNNTSSVDVSSESKRKRSRTKSKTSSDACNELIQDTCDSPDVHDNNLVDYRYANV